MTFRPFASIYANAALVCVASLASLPVHAADNGDTETIVMVRHGEKPSNGLGQLTCQGLNRALALPRVIEAKFGRPAAAFAPDPAKEKSDDGASYDYVRPLATVEPSAVYFGLPVNTAFDFRDPDGLIAALLEPRYRNSMVVVAWEHKVIEAMARTLLTRYGGDASSVPHWKGSDFDSIYIVRIKQGAAGAKPTVSFEVGHEGLNDRPTVCPG